MFIKKSKKLISFRNDIDSLDIYFIHFTNTFHTPRKGKLINIPSGGIGIISKIPLFKNDHLLIKYKYKNFEFQEEAIVFENKLDYAVLKFLTFTSVEQENIDKLLEASLRKRF